LATSCPDERCAASATQRVRRDVATGAEPRRPRNLTTGNEIVAICRRDNHKQTIAILELPLPDPAPDGAEWIEAYRR
jgi:hypothetical protein